MMAMNLTLIRGIPGSGKSTLAKSIVDLGNSVLHFEADQFFVNTQTGEYKFDGLRIGEAHEWCQDSTKRYLDRGYDVVVSNTFTRLNELRPYFKIARDFGIMPAVFVAQGGYNNVHGVPANVLANMRARFEYDVTPLFDEFFPNR